MGNPSVRIKSCASLPLGKQITEQIMTKKIRKMVFDGTFPKKWELMEEMTLMKKENLDYPPWVAETLVKKGFVARILTKELNIKRKDLKGFKRRTDAEHDQDGKPIRRRNRHRIEYNPDAHVENNR
jgi:hypothetical protein